jgi:heme exporter protein A
MGAVQTAMISVAGLSKAFGRQFALRGVDLEVQAGQFVALVGPNGAGKTTLLRILAGLNKPTKGRVRIAGMDAALAPEQARRAVGFLSHHPLLYEELTAEENLRFYGTMYDVPRLNARIEELLCQVGLSARRASQVRTYSRGMRQRLSIARALLHSPPVLLLDEPYTGLDQGACEMLDRLLMNVGVGSRTVLLTTHSLEQGLRLSSRAVLLVNGQITYQTDEGTPDLERFWAEYRQASATSGRR